MLKRIITGTILIACLVGFFVLRAIDFRLFLPLLMAVAIIGSYEFTKMASKHLTIAKKIIILSLGALLVPTFCLFESLYKSGMLAGAILIIVAIIAMLCTLVFEFDDKIENLGIGFIGIIYPSLFVLLMCGLNGLEVYYTYTKIKFIPLISAFAIAPISDTFAYFTGVLLGKRKIFSKISPKKTLAGYIGAIVGGLVAGLLIYVIFRPDVKCAMPLLVFMLIGLFGAVFSAFGDLLESALKRKFEIKDSGNLFPGHGGVLDRVDSIMFVSAFIYAVFILII